METLLNENDTFNALKYKRYTSVNTVVNGVYVTANTTYWVNDNGQVHRDDGPAIEWNDGSKLWYKNGKLHRENGAAIVCATGYKEWWINGKCIKRK